MDMNYDASKVGEPYPRVDDIQITYGTDMKGQVTASQTRAVTLADGSIGLLGPMPRLVFTVDPMDATTEMPLVDYITGAALGPTVTPQQVFLANLALIRFQQLKG